MTALGALIVLVAMILILAFVTPLQRPVYILCIVVAVVAAIVLILALLGVSIGELGRELEQDTGQLRLGGAAT